MFILYQFHENETLIKVTLLLKMHTLDKDVHFHIMKFHKNETLIINYIFKRKYSKKNILKMVYVALLLFFLFFFCVCGCARTRTGVRMTVCVCAQEAVNHRAFL